LRKIAWIYVTTSLLACVGFLVFVVLSGDPCKASDLLAALGVVPAFLLFPASLFFGYAYLRSRFEPGVGSGLRWPLVRLAYFGLAVLGHVAVLLLGARFAVGSDSRLMITISNVVGYGLMANLVVSIVAFIAASVAMGVRYMHSLRSRS
jgi:hypothetical protein